MNSAHNNTDFMYLIKDIAIKEIARYKYPSRVNARLHEGIEKTPLGDARAGLVKLEISVCFGLAMVVGE